MGTAARPAPHRQPVDFQRRADRPDVARAVSDASPRLGGRAAIPGPVITDEPEATPGGIGHHGAYRCREQGVPSWTSTTRPAGSPASSTARVRPSGVRTAAPCLPTPRPPPRGHRTWPAPSILPPVNEQSMLSNAFSAAVPAAARSGGQPGDVTVTRGQPGRPSGLDLASGIQRGW
jgi:hypothetical protein